MMWPIEMCKGLQLSVFNWLNRGLDLGQQFHMQVHIHRMNVFLSVVPYR